MNRRCSCPTPRPPFMGADFCDVSAGDTVAVFGAGGVGGLMAAKSALLLGAERAIVIDRVPERLSLAII